MGESESEAEARSKAARARGVERMLNGEDPPQEPPKGSPEAPTEVGGASKVGESINRRGEDVADEGQERGKADTGTEGTSDRPTGTSTGRAASSVDPQGSQDPESPEAPPGG